MADIAGTDGDDTLVGTYQPDVIRGVAGNDRLFGGLGNDALFGGLGSDELFGDDGSDLLLGGVRRDSLNGGDGADRLEGGDGNDRLSGGLGSDTLRGGAGNDTLFGDFNDVLETDHFDGGAGIDTVSYSSIAFASIHLHLGTKTATFPGSPNAELELLSSIENAWTGFGIDTLIGGNQANELHGLNRADLLIGGGGADRLFGGFGFDTFQFRTGDSTPTARDTVLPEGSGQAFEGAGEEFGDRIDLSPHDADITAAGRQPWEFGRSGEKGHLWATDKGSMTLIRGNVDNDATPEFEVAIIDGATLATAYTAEDFVL